jgi:hypothetical protein
MAATCGIHHRVIEAWASNKSVTGRTYLPSNAEPKCLVSPTTPRGRLKNKDKTKSNNTAITRRASNTPQSDKALSERLHTERIVEYDGGWMGWDDDGWTGGHSQITEAELYQQSM